MAAVENDAMGDAAATAGVAAPGGGTRGAISEEEVSALLEARPAGGVRPYDFTAQRINRTQLPMLEVVAKAFADRMAGTLSGLLGRDAVVHFSALDSAKAGELQAALPVPGCLAIVRLAPLAGAAFVTVEPRLLLTLLDGFFGGSGRAAGDPQAAVAPAALRFQALLLRSVAADWSAAWMPVTPLQLELTKQETNPRLMQLGAVQEPMVVLKFTVEFGANSGRIDWLLPESVLEPIREMLSADSGAAPARPQAAWGPSLGSALQEAEVETHAILAQAQISLRDLVRLTPGDVIPIDAPQHVTLLAGQVPLYRGRFGVSQGRNALKITSGGSA